ncbi:MAG: glycosyltransferase family 2 protein [Bacteroidales bacterium]
MEEEPLKIEAMESHIPKISVITVCLNTLYDIEATIESVLVQTYSNIEYIIIDGGSTDGTVDIIQRYQDRITYWVSELDKGIYDAMNKGIEIATGEYIHFLNSADTFCNEMVLSEASEIMLNENPLLLIGGVMSKDKCSYNYMEVGTLSSFYRKATTICHQAIFHRADVFTKYGNYSISYKIISDHEWMLRFLIRKTEDELVSYVNKPFVYYDTNGLSANSRLTVLDERIRMIKDQKTSSFDFVIAYIRLNIRKARFITIRIMKKLGVYKRYRKIFYLREKAI